MRCDNIEITIKIPVPIDKPDGNGMQYTEKAIINACKEASDTPIIQFDENGKEVVIGIAKHVEYENGYIIVNGISWHGGTCEKIESLNGKTITSMKISEFGLTT